MVRRRRSVRHKRAGAARHRLVPYRRRLRFEPLEDRLLLAGVMVGHARGSQVSQSVARLRVSTIAAMPTRRPSARLDS